MNWQWWISPERWWYVERPIPLPGLVAVYAASIVVALIIWWAAR